MKQNTGFTLVEILTAVVIVTILVAMAAPLYEKTIERSRMAEARTILAKLQDAKLFAMDNMGCTTYDSTNTNCPKLGHLNVAFVKEAVVNSDDLSFETDDFHYSLAPSSKQESWLSNAVCAKRKGGDYAGTIFVYAAPGVASADSAARFSCLGTHCKDYGQEDDSELPVFSRMTCN